MALVDWQSSKSVGMVVGLGIVLPNLNVTFGRLGTNAKPASFASNGRFQSSGSDFVVFKGKLFNRYGH